jgi:hypothetical protein
MYLKNPLPRGAHLSASPSLRGWPTCQKSPSTRLPCRPRPPRQGPFLSQSRPAPCHSAPQAPSPSKPTLLLAPGEHCCQCELHETALYTTGPLVAFWSMPFTGPSRSRGPLSSRRLSGARSPASPKLAGQPSPSLSSSHMASLSLTALCSLSMCRTKAKAGRRFPAPELIVSQSAASWCCNSSEHLRSRPCSECSPRLPLPPASFLAPVQPQELAPARRPAPRPRCEGKPGSSHVCTCPFMNFKNP